MGKQLK